MVRGAGIEPARPFGHSILSAARLPVTTPARLFFLIFGGAYEIRTRVLGFADPCLTPRPTRHVRIDYTLAVAMIKPPHR